nr:hypothetical protein [Lachnospiraceae bacterium]
MKKEYKLNDLIFSLIINAAALIVSVFLFCPFFEENDDAFLSMISEGAYGMRDHHLIYSNVIYGRLLVFLNSLIPSVRWHSILQYIMIFAAMTAVTFLICRYLKNRLFAVMFVLASFYELYVSLQYSKTAVFVGTAGFILLLCVARLSDICMEGEDGTDKEKKVTGRAL